jgi:predicted RNA-binding protein with PIN domain
VMLADLALGKPPSRRSAKGRHYHDDVLPMWIAEMDFHAPSRSRRRDSSNWGASTREGAVSQRQLMVVDAANVIGSRPDGWWRDRPAAVLRLITALAGSRRNSDDVIVVVEGAARAGVGAGVLEGVRVVHAPGSADDEIVRIIAEAKAEGEQSVTVVTADRELRDRTSELGARLLGPGALWERLDRGS